jgi:hypothetical protein
MPSQEFADLLNKLREDYNVRREKYVYYVVALSVACIGFSVYQTRELPLTFSQIPLGIAVINWGISIYSGLSYLKGDISILIKDHNRVKIAAGLHELSGNNPNLIERGLHIAEREMKKDEPIALRMHTLLEVCFYSGVLWFVIWHGIEMYLRIK